MGTFRERVLPGTWIELFDQFCVAGEDDEELNEEHPIVGSELIVIVELLIDLDDPVVCANAQQSSQQFL